MMENPLQAFLDVLVHRWRVVGTMAVLAMLAAALVSLTQRPTYEATALIALSPATLSIPPSNQSPPYYLMVDSPRRLPIAYTPAYYVALLKSVPVGTAQAAVAISLNSSDRSLIEITARSESARAAADAANALAQAGVDTIEQAILPGGDEVALAFKNLTAAEQALSQFAQDNGLQETDLMRMPSPPLPADKQQELWRLLRVRDTAEAVYQDFARDQASAAILAATAYKPTTIPAREPTAPISPKPLQDIAIGGLLGLLVGLLAAFALEYAAGKTGERQTTVTGVAGN